MRLKRHLGAITVSAGLALSALVSSGCASSPLVKVADKPDFPALAKGIDAEKRAGRLSKGDVRDIAEAVAKGEVRRAKGPEGERILVSFGSCANELEGALDDRYDKGDDMGALAANVMMSSGVVGIGKYVRFARDNDPRGAFRALGARGLVSDGDFALRRKLFVDLDERVRVNALKAAMTAPSKDDLELLIEAGRVDPHPDARAAAVRAIGRVGGERAGEALKDIWIRADATLRDAIVDGFMAPRSYEAGGREQLVKAAESGQSGSIQAAIALSHVSIDEAVDRSAHDIAMGVLLRTIKIGTRADRTLAMLSSPSDAEVMKALREAKDDTDAGIALIALGRLAREGKDEAEKKAAREGLLKIAKGKDSEAPRAMGELASLGDRRAVPLLEKALSSKSAFERGYAARNLVVLGELTKAAKVLADSDVYARASTACAVIHER